MLSAKGETGSQRHSSFVLLGFPIRSDKGHSQMNQRRAVAVDFIRFPCQGGFKGQSGKRAQLHRHFHGRKNKNFLNPITDHSAPFVSGRAARNCRDLRINKPLDFKRTKGLGFKSKGKFDLPHKFGIGGFHRKIKNLLAKHTDRSRGTGQQAWNTFSNRC